MILQTKHVKLDFCKMIFQIFQIPIYKYEGIWRSGDRACDKFL